MILNIHPEGSDPSNLGTSSFIRERLIVCGFGVGMAEDDEGEGE